MSDQPMSTPRMPAVCLPHGGGPSFFMTGERKHLYQPTEDFLRSIRSTLPTTRTMVCSSRRKSCSLKPMCRWCPCRCKPGWTRCCIAALQFWRSVAPPARRRRAGAGQRHELSQPAPFQPGRPSLAGVSQMAGCGFARRLCRAHPPAWAMEPGPRRARLTPA